MDYICAAVSQGLPNHYILTASGGPSLLPIITSSTYSDNTFSAEKYFCILSVLYLLVSACYLPPRIQTSARAKEKTSSIGCYSVPQSWNRWLHCFSCFLKSFSDETRVLQSLFFADNVGSPPSGAVGKSLSYCCNWKSWEHGQEPRMLVEEQQHPEAEDSVKNGSCKKYCLKKVLVHENPSHQSVQRWKGREYREFFISFLADREGGMHTRKCLHRQCI